MTDQLASEALFALPGGAGLKVAGSLGFVEDSSDLHHISLSLRWHLVGGSFRGTEDMG